MKRGTRCNPFHFLLQTNEIVFFTKIRLHYPLTFFFKYIGRILKKPLTTEWFKKRNAIDEDKLFASRKVNANFLNFKKCIKFTNVLIKRNYVKYDLFFFFPLLLLKLFQIPTSLHVISLFTLLFRSDLWKRKLTLEIMIKLSTFNFPIRFIKRNEFRITRLNKVYFSLDYILRNNTGERLREIAPLLDCGFLIMQHWLVNFLEMDLKVGIRFF